MATSGEALLRDIQDERTRELAFEGGRLWDLRRWGLPCARHDSQDAESLVVVPASRTIGLARANSDAQFVWGIPMQDLLGTPF